MQTISELKEQSITETPLLLFECVLPDGRSERWSTHRASVGEAAYEARVLQHNVFEMQAASDQGADGIPRLSVTLANADSHFSEIERATGWKGARLKVAFLFYDLRGQVPASETSVLFEGICNPPDEIREATFRITAVNRMNLQRVLLPQVRIQRRCPWDFPADDPARAEARDGGVRGKYSRYYRCGYSAGSEGGQGNLDAGKAFTNCGYTRGDCVARGMFAHFGGIGFVPPAIQVRTSGDKNWHTSALSVNGARYNDFVPLLYGTAWYTPPVVFARNDGNLTRMEVLLGSGEMAGVLKVLVNEVEIPPGVPGQNMTGTGWYNTPTLGSRAGTPNPEFSDGNGQPAGDPYGSMAYISVAVPNRLNDGSSLPRVKVLAQGLKLPMYGTDGQPTGEEYTNNPAWVLLDVLRRTGWGPSELDLGSFAAAAAYCGETMESKDIYGNPVVFPRFQCNIALQNRRSAGDVARGIRTAARIQLTYGRDGRLCARVENTLANEQRTKPAWSNSAEVLNGGWPSYEFGDGASGFGGILRRPNGEPSLRVYSRSMAESPNRLSVEFQDAFNGYQQDSFAVVDPGDVARTGQEVSAAVSALGLANYDQAARILKVQLDKSVRGNTYVEFESSVKALGVRPGDLITVTYLKEGLQRQLFRVVKIAPGANHRTCTITGQIHDDSWYADSGGLANAGGASAGSGGGAGSPKPLVGSMLDEFGEMQFSVTESAESATDGSVASTVSVKWNVPAQCSGPGPSIPLVQLMANVAPGGALGGGQALFYALAGLDAAGNESALSFVVRAWVEMDGSKVTLSGISLAPGTTGFHVYRGHSPAQLFRIASNQAPSVEFTDPGFPQELVPAPDPNYDHANFYWRMEIQPEEQVGIHGPNTVGSAALEMTPNTYRGMTARVTRGRGAGQERTIGSNTETTVTVYPPWTVEPDSTSRFAIAESGWRFGAQAKSGQVAFAIPNRSGQVAHITGRAANANDVECAPELCMVTRWQIGGGGVSDVGPPPKPSFGLGPGRRGGTVELSGVSFAELTNTRSISAATLTVYYWDELRGASVLRLQGEVGPADSFLDLTQAGEAEAGSYLQIDSEILRVLERLNNGARYRVQRAAHQSEASTHAGQTAVYELAQSTAIAPFPQEFFGSPYCGGWSYPVVLPDARITSAELLVTNPKGNSETSSVCLTHTSDHGLRTLSGGQYAMQVDGFLAADGSSGPAVVVETAHAVRDVYAVLGRAADADVKLRVNVDGSAYCLLTIPKGTSVSNSVSGSDLSPLATGSNVTLSVLQVGQAYPGADLTVVIRL